MTDPTPKPWWPPHAAGRHVQEPAPDADPTRAERYSVALATARRDGLAAVDAVMAVADEEVALARQVAVENLTEAHTWKAKFERAESNARGKQAVIEAQRATLDQMREALDIRFRAHEWMRHLGYEDEHIAKAEAWRQPIEPWLQDDPPMPVQDLETACGFALLYHEALTAILDAPQPEAGGDDE